MAGTKESERTGYLFFLEWQFYQRREFLLQLDQLRKLHRKDARNAREENKKKSGVQCYPKLTIETALEEIRRENRSEKSTSYNQLIDLFLTGHVKHENLLDRFLSIYNGKRPMRFQKQPEQLLEEYLNSRIALNNLIDHSPNWFRRQHHQVCIHKDNDGKVHPVVENLTTNADQLQNISHEAKALKSITDDMNNYEVHCDESEDTDLCKIFTMTPLDNYKLRLLSEVSTRKMRTSLDHLDPNQRYYITPLNHDKLHCIAQISTKKKKMDSDSLMFHLIGLCLWDMKIENPSVEIRSLIKKLIENHPSLPEADERDLTPDIFDKYYKCYKTTRDSIGYINLLPF